MGKKHPNQQQRKELHLSSTAIKSRKGGRKKHKNRIVKADIKRTLCPFHERKKIHLIQSFPNGTYFYVDPAKNNFQKYPSHPTP